MNTGIEHTAHEYWMQQALELAHKAASLGEVPIGAVIVKDGKMIGQGYNRREIDRNPLGHAEMMAIKNASQSIQSWRLAGCSLYVTLEPCPMCAGAIVQARMAHVVFGTEDPKSGFAGSLANPLQDDRLNHRVEITAGVCREACSHLLRSFFRRLRNGENEGNP